MNEMLKHLVFDIDNVDELYKFRVTQHHLAWTLKEDDESQILKMFKNSFFQWIKQDPDKINDEQEVRKFLKDFAKTVPVSLSMFFSPVTRFDKRDIDGKYTLLFSWYMEAGLMKLQIALSL